eukprot:Opistho-1_new@8441
MRRPEDVLAERLVIDARLRRTNGEVGALILVVVVVQEVLHRARLELVGVSLLALARGVDGRIQRNALVATLDDQAEAVLEHGRVEPKRRDEIVCHRADLVRVGGEQRDGRLGEHGRPLEGLVQTDVDARGGKGGRLLDHRADELDREAVGAGVHEIEGAELDGALLGGKHRVDGQRVDEVHGMVLPDLLEIGKGDGLAPGEAQVLDFLGAEAVENFGETGDRPVLGREGRYARDDLGDALVHGLGEDVLRTAEMLRAEDAANERVVRFVEEEEVHEAARLPVGMDEAARVDVHVAAGLEALLHEARPHVLCVDT